jgi:DNA-3-methyladenine glycosylase
MGPRSWTVAKSSSGPLRRTGRAFFDRPATRVARELLGGVLRVRSGEGWRGIRLVEVEAYLRGDPASHAFRGPTRRNRSMFGRPGTLYVYRIHQVVCANLVARAGEAVLLRAGSPVEGTLSSPSGPGRLCRALGITIADDGVDVVGGGRVRCYRLDPTQWDAPRIVRAPRVGIRLAAERPLRFALEGDPWVSRPHPSWRATSASPNRTRAGGPSRRNHRTRRPSSGGDTSGGRNAGR